MLLNSNIITGIVIQQFISIGMTRVKHLCELKSYEPQFNSKWIFESLKREITVTSLSQDSSCCGPDAFIKHVTHMKSSVKKIKISQS